MLVVKEFEEWRKSLKANCFKLNSMKQSIMHNKQIYRPSFDTFCFQNCIKYILEFYDVQNSDFYINRSLSMLVKKDQGFNADIYYEKNARSLLPFFSDRVKRYYLKDAKGDDVFWDNVDLVKSGVPIIVGVDSYYLSYLPYYMKSHGRHTIIMSNYDENDDTVEVVDWMSPWFFKGKVNRDEFIAARDSQNPYDGGVFSGKPILNNWAEVLNENFCWDAEKLIRNTAELSLEQYFYPVQKDDDAFEGLEALKFITSLVSMIENELTVEAQQHFLKKLHGNLYKLNCRRTFWSDFLHQAYELKGDECFSKMCSNTELVIGEWEKLLYKIIKSSMRPQKGYSKVIEGRMYELIEMELEGGCILKQFIS